MRALASRKLAAPDFFYIFRRVRCLEGSMREKTSITLSSEVLAKVDRLAGSKRSRSAVIEQVLGDYFTERSRTAAHARDVERINASAEHLNREAAEVLEYQVSFEE
jgi:predicted transcriptional regulator